MKIARIKAIQDLDEQEAAIDYRAKSVYPAYEKELLDRYLAAKGNIRVFIRVRPILKDDYTAYSGTRDSFAAIEKQINIPNPQQIELDITSSTQNRAANMISQKQQPAQSSQLFNFDAVFDKQSTQTQIYSEV